MKHLKLKKIIASTLVLSAILGVNPINTALAATINSDQKPQKIEKCTLLESHNEILNVDELLETAKKGTDPNIKIEGYKSNGDVKSISQVVSKYEDPSTGKVITELNITSLAAFKAPEENKSENANKSNKVLLKGSATIDDSKWDSTYAVKISLTSKIYTYQGSDGNKYYRIVNAVVNVTNTDSSVSIRSGKVTLGQSGTNYNGAYKSQTTTETFYDEVNETYYPGNWDDIYKYNPNAFKIGSSLIVYLERGSSKWDTGYLSCNYSD